MAASVCKTPTKKNESSSSGPKEGQVKGYQVFL